ncbi:hypothetical protein APHAL10511_007652 [Amanita phalloides]|nr:hypothetical protein APHAL10511_007652 [Amanita phalloides]
MLWFPAILIRFALSQIKIRCICLGRCHLPVSSIAWPELDYICWTTHRPDSCYLIIMFLTQSTPSSLPRAAQKLEPKHSATATSEELHFCVERIQKHKSAIMEALLSPFKYTAFTVIGYAALRHIGCMDDLAVSAWTYGQCGLLGGAMLTVLFLTHLLTTAEMEDRYSSDMLRDQLILIITEMAYSAIAACAGGLTIRVAHRCIAQVAIVGAIGALLSFVLLYMTLGAVLGILWIVLKYRAAQTIH